MIQITKTIVFSGSILIAGPTIALAQVGSEVVVERPDSDSRSTYGLQLEAATELPLFVGGRLQFRLPGRLHVGAGLGALPGGLLDATSGVVTSVARLDEGLSALVTEGLDDGWMAKTYIGWTPFFGEAFYVQAGYAYLGLNGGLNAADLGLLGVDLQGLPVAGTAGLGAALHAGELELGFRWAIDNVRIRLSIGVTAVLAAQSSVEIEATGLPTAQADLLERETEAVVDDALTRYGLLPTLGLGVAYDLGF